MEPVVIMLQSLAFEEDSPLPTFCQNPGVILHSSPSVPQPLGIPIMLAFDLPPNIVSTSYTSLYLSYSHPSLQVTVLSLQGSL